MNNKYIETLYKNEKLIIYFFKSTEELRQWFYTHCNSSSLLWLGFYKKNSLNAKISLTYHEALNQALCFGWIDSTRIKLDNQSYANRFTPRLKNSHWSIVNIKKAEQLIADNLMTQYGLIVYKRKL